MTLFTILAILLIVGVAAFLVPPLWFGHRKQAEADRKAANLAIFRDQLGELERERSEGSLADADFEQAKRELQRRLLEEVDGEGATTTVDAASSRKTAIAVVVLLPVLALAGYGVLGNPQALDPTAVMAQKQMTPADIEAMVARLAARQQENPEDMQGWLMLGRSYKMLGRYAESVQAYQHAESAIAQDPDLLATYAETIAMANGKGLAGKPRQLVEQALKIDPNHAHSLFLAGAAAIEAGEKKKAIAYWEAVLPQVEPGSDVEKMIRGGLEKLKNGDKK